MRTVVLPLRSVMLAAALIGSLAACSDDDDDAKTLTATSAEPFGANCPAGGSLVRTGRDKNLNGVLDPDEIQTSTYNCVTPASQTAGPTMTQADIDALADVNVITGDLRIVGSLASNISLPNLIEVTGSVYIANNPAATTIALPALAKVGGGVDVDENRNAATINLGSLSTVGGHLVIVAVSSATKLTLSSLQTIGGDFALSAAGASTALQLPASVGTTAAPADLTIDGVPSSALAFNGGTVTGDLAISNNPQLTQLSASNVTVGGYLFVSGNHALPAAQATAFATATGVAAAKQQLKDNAL